MIASTSARASALVLATGAAWGLYWVPVRALDGMGLTGAWGTLAITAAALAVLTLATARNAHALRRADPVTLLALALGGAAFALYSIGFVYGRVALIILLYFLTPVWSTLIARFLLGWPTPPARLWAIAVGLAGLAVMLGSEGGLPLPRGVGEWMALLAGVLWSVATTGIRTRAALPPAAAALVFAAGACVCALVLAPLLPAAPVQMPALPALGLALATGALWWGLSVAGLLWAAARLEPARTGILLMAEVPVGAASAALLAGERLSPAEIAGGALVLTAAVLEIASTRHAPAQR